MIGPGHAVSSIHCIEYKYASHVWVILGVLPMLQILQLSQLTLLGLLRLLLVSQIRSA